MAEEKVIKLTAIQAETLNKASYYTYHDEDEFVEGQDVAPEKLVAIIDALLVWGPLYQETGKRRAAYG